MTIDKSLRRKGRLVRPRNVLTRAERLERLTMAERYQAGEDSPFGLPKVKIIRVSVGKKKKKKKDEDEE